MFVRTVIAERKKDSMVLTRKERLELNEMSKQVFGTSSRWQKIVNNGVAEPYERDREVMVPTSGGVEKKVYTDTKNVLRRYSIEEVKKLMTDIIQERKEKFEKAKIVNAAEVLNKE